MTYLIQGGQILTEKLGLIGGDLLIKDGVIAAIGENLPADGEIVDAAGCFVVPGLVDIHNHGFRGTEFASANEEFDGGTLELAKRGITTVVPTVRCLPMDRLLAAIENIKKEMVRRPAGAKLAGINLEGPFLSPARIGSMVPENLAKPGKEALSELLSACEGTLRSITLAPELPGVLPLIEDILFAGANPAIGHSNATYAEAQAAVEAGANLVTHLFNAMRPFTHRDPGLIGEALTDDRLTCELICDFVHNDPAAVDLAIRAKGVENIVMISDTGRMAGLGDGEYIIEGRKRIVSGKLCKTEDGVIAGSVCSLFDGFRNLLLRGYPLSDVSRMASFNPAKMTGIDRHTGSISVGKAADLLLLDGTFSLRQTWVDGVRATPSS